MKDMDKVSSHEEEGKVSKVAETRRSLKLKVVVEMTRYFILNVLASWGKVPTLSFSCHCKRGPVIGCSGPSFARVQALQAFQAVQALQHSIDGGVQGGS